MQGINYENNPTRIPDVFNERGSWRIEVSPRQATTSNNFLNVIQVMDGDFKKKLNVELIDEEKIVGVSIGNRVVTFSKNSQIINYSISISLKKRRNPENLNYRFIIWHLANIKKW